MGSSEGASAAAREAAEFARKLIEDAPTLVSRGWLPEETGFESLDGLAEEHRRLLSSRTAITAERSALRDQYEAEDLASSQALERAFSSGGTVDAPTVTPPEERAAAMSALNHRLAAANGVLGQFVQRVIGRVESEADAMLGELVARRGATAARRQEAEQILAEAREEETEVQRLDDWIVRNAGRHEMASRRNVPGMRFVGWDLMKTSQPPRPPQTNAWGESIPETVDTYPGPEQHAANLNRGRVPALDEMTSTTERNDR